MKKKVLITNSFNLHHAEIVLGEKADVIVTASANELLLPLVQDVHGIVAHNTVLGKKIIDAAPLLCVIATPQVGFDKIDLAAATDAGVAVVANLGLGAEAVAEFTVGLMLALSRRIVKADRDLRSKKNWSVRRFYLNPSLDMGMDLYGATVGIVGLGAIGHAVAGLCRAAFKAQIMAYDPFVGDDDMASQGIEKQNYLIDMARKVDFLLIHTALNDNSKHLIDEDVLRAMKPGAFVINCARGEIIDEAALVKALDQGWIAGAATDVFDREPIDPKNPLLALDNIIVTPHIAGITRQTSVARAEKVVEGIVDAFAGKKPNGLVNKEVWPLFLDKLNRVDTC